MRHAYCSTNQLSEPPMMSEVRGERLQFKHREVVMVTVNVLPWWCSWEKVYWKGSVWLCVSIVSGLPSWVTHYPQASAASGGERQHCIHRVTHTHTYTHMHAMDQCGLIKHTHTVTQTSCCLLSLLTFTLATHSWPVLHHVTEMEADAQNSVTIQDKSGLW